MKEALSSSETSVLKTTTRRNFPENAILHSHRRENHKTYTNDLSTVGDGAEVRIQAPPQHEPRPKQYWVAGVRNQTILGGMIRGCHSGGSAYPLSSFVGLPYNRRRDVTPHTT
jgi:hypothetical protein